METFLGLDYNLWWFLVFGGVISGYAILDGFDLGAGALHLLLNKEQSRRIALNAIGPVWDGNEVWLVIGGGALFAGFPVAYAAIFSAFYVPFMVFMVGLIFRAVAIEFRSFSKTAGFTGTRCGYTIVPKTVFAFSKNGEKVSLNKLWLRRQSTKFNGTSYVVQRAAEATFTPEGKKQVRTNIEYYMDNARIIREALESNGIEVFGGVNAPYIWAKTPKGTSSWSYFDYLLKEKNIVCTPGSGFGPSGEGYVRFSAFGDKKQTIKAMQKISK